MGKYTYKRLDSTIDVSQFDCGNEDLNDFLKNDALSNQNDCLSTTRVAFTDENKIIAFFTITPDTIYRGNIDVSDKIPDYPYGKYPAIKLARFAVQKEKQHQGVGTEIMADIFLFVNVVSRIMGGKFFTVDAKETACEFYKELGFKELSSKHPDNIIPLYIDNVAQNKELTNDIMKNILF